MEDKIVSYKTDKLATQNGFDSGCIAPTQSTLQKWLREVHNVFITISTDCTSYPKFCYSIDRFIGNPNNLAEREWYWDSFSIKEWYLYKSYEEALEYALEEAMALLTKDKNHCS